MSVETAFGPLILSSSLTEQKQHFCFPALTCTYWFCTVPVSAAWMQVTTPAELWKCSCHLHWGEQQRWGTFPPSLSSGRKSLQGSLQKALLLPQQLLLLQPPEEAPGTTGADRFLKTHLPNTQSVCCVSVSLSWGWGSVFQTACLDNRGVTPELPNVQFLF